MEKYILKNDTMNESELQRVFTYRINPRDSKNFSNKRFVIIDNGSQCCTHWCTFYVKNNKSFYFDSFGGQPEKFLLNQLPKRKIYHIYKLQDINSRLCGSYCL